VKLLKNTGKNCPKKRNEFSDGCKRRWEKLSDEEKSKILSRLHHVTVSSIEGRVNNILLKWGLEYTHSFYLKFKQFDFRIGKILLEVNGDFYHANPDKYKHNDMLPFPFGNKILAQELWNRDLKKKNMAEKMGYFVVYVWENEIRRCNDEELEKLVAEKLLLTEDLSCLIK